jgi:uncharacterized protein (TIGR02147 family)
MPRSEVKMGSMRESAGRPVLLDQLDYREFIRSFFAWQKGKDKAFSFRVFALRCGIPASSASFICRVISGERMLTNEQCLKFSKGMGLAAEESRYFNTLVQFNQAKSMETKNHFFLELSKFRGSRAKRVGEDQFQFYTHWLNQVLWAYFGATRDQKHPADIAKRIFPSATAREVEDSIALLLRLKLIKKLANGYAPADTQISTEKELRDLTVKRQLREMINLSLEVLDRTPAPIREYNSLTMYMSKKCLETVKERIGSFREELRSLLENDRNEDRVYTLTMQLFPNTVIDD